SHRWAIFMVAASIVVLGIFAFASGSLDFMFKQWAFGLRNTIPGLATLGVNKESLRWAMVLCILVTYPMAILWHWGAMALPKGQLDADGKAVTETATLGDANAKA